MHWNFSKWDWDEILRILTPVFFAATFGIVLAYVLALLLLQRILDSLMEVLNVFLVQSR